MEGMKAFQRYMALKLHFTTDYDYFKYQGKTRRISEAAFEARKDHMHFARIERRYKNNLEEFLVANFVDNPNAKWVGDLLTVEAEKIHLNWRKRVQALRYQFKQELSDLSNPMALTVITGKQHPPLLRYFMANKITIETMVIMNALCGYVNEWDRVLDDHVWQQAAKRIRKYEPFLKVKKEDFLPVFNEVCSLHES